MSKESKALTRPIKSPNIKVKALKDDPIRGLKEGDVVSIAYKFFNQIPADARQNYELVEGPETLEEYKGQLNEAYRDRVTEANKALEVSGKKGKKTKE